MRVLLVRDLPLNFISALLDIGYIKGTFDYTWELADGMSWASLHYLASELATRNLIQTSSPLKTLKSTFTTASSYPLKDQVILTSTDLNDQRMMRRFFNRNAI